eukprot:jgi/Chrpa1/6845/Chrysochromulina_OHIO_Genome00011708-RA
MASVAKPLAELLKAASAERDVSAKVESAELCEPGSSTCAGFPRVVHQSWRSTELPSSLAEWQRTWAEMNPGYTLRLWTDANNERFIAQHYPWFLRYFRQYDKMIKRADAVRPFYLYHFGGVYADLDFACIRPFDALLQRHASSQVLLGELQKGAHESQSVPNALMISKPRARFWLLVMRELVRRVNCADPMFDTGPAMLTMAPYTVLTTAPCSSPQVRRCSPKWRARKALRAVSRCSTRRISTASAGTSATGRAWSEATG